MTGVSEADAVTSSDEQFNVIPATSPLPGEPQMDQQMRGADAVDTYRNVGVASPPFQQSVPGGAEQGMNLNSGNLNSGGSGEKRKRGRPRKYGPPDANTAMVVHQSMSVGGSDSPSKSMGGSDSASPSPRKGRGRPPGSSNKKKQSEAIGSTGIGFIPHLINVQAGEDVCSKVMAFSQNGPRTVCILSANGIISNVTLRQASTSGGTATYEGRFDILSLSGSFMLSDTGGKKSRIGGLSTTLVGTDGRVFGGCVAGLLIAASPIQVILGSFLADGGKPPTPVHIEPFSDPPKGNMGGAGTSSSPSRGTFSESSGGPASPLNLSSGACNNPHGLSSSMPWK